MNDPTETERRGSCTARTAEGKPCKAYGDPYCVAHGRSPETRKEVARKASAARRAKPESGGVAAAITRAAAVIGPPPCDADGFSLSNSEDVTPLLSWCARAVAHGVMSAHGANAISQLAKAQSQVRDVALTN